MKLIRGVLRSVNLRLCYPCNQPQIIRTFSANAASAFDEREGSNSFESADDFERRMFSSDVSGDPKSSSFFHKFDRIYKGQGISGSGSKMNGERTSDLMDGLDETFSTLADGLDGKLEEEARYFEFDSEEVDEENYTYRPDTEYRLGDTYTTKDLDLRKPAVRKPFKRFEFETTTEEVLRKADFRNVRFLANFITEAGVIIKRSKTKISAKAQRKVAREIKTARAFGLMPFTTMGTKEFMFGRTMEDLDQDYEYETLDTHNFVADDPGEA